MTTYQDRVDQFSSDREPPAGAHVQLLCADRIGTYVLPFNAEKTAEGWINTVTGDALECEVIGWRISPKLNDS